MAREPMKDIIVLLPGITGSVLEKDGKVAWGFNAGSITKAAFTRGDSMKKALLLKDDSRDVDDLGDGVTATRLIPDLHLIPGLTKIDGYSKVASYIKATFDVTLDENYFEFPYDWRRTNVVAARKLRRQSHDWLKRWREKTNNRDAKLILVAHSMGGLVSRYFLEIFEGWKDTRALITFGTPYRGALNSVDSLANGVRKGPLGLLDLSELTRSFTAVYELLPRYACYDPGDGNLVRVGETSGIPNVDPARAAAALAFHNEIDDAVTAKMETSAYRDGRYVVHPVIGVQQKTAQTARRDGNGVRMLDERNGKDESGDGTVPRVSAIPLEYSNANVGMFAATKHAALQNADAVLIQLEGVITGMALDLGAVKAGPGLVSLSLEVEDLYFDSEPVVVRVRPDKAGTELTARIISPATNSEAGTRKLTESPDGWHVGDFGRLQPGEYRVTVTGEKTEPAMDAFAVGETPELP
jgi:hypothetical protein